MLGRTECAGVHHLRAQLLPIVVSVAGGWMEIKKEGPNGQMTDHTSRNPAHQTQNENPNQQQHRHQQFNSSLLLAKPTAASS